MPVHILQPDGSYDPPLVAPGDDPSVAVGGGADGYVRLTSGVIVPASAAQGRTDLGLGTAATHPAGDFETAGAAAAEASRAMAAEALAALKANNLSDLANAGTARTNLGLGTAATHPAGDFATAAHTHAEADVTGLTADLAAKLVKASNLSDLASAATARTNLGLGDVATHAASEFATAAGTVGGPPKIVRRTSDSAAKTNNTLANDDTLLFSVGANDVWDGRLKLMFSGADSTHDTQVAITVPSGTAVFASEALTASALASFGGVGVASSPVALLGASAPIAFGSFNGTYGIVLEFTVEIGATPGNVVVQWAQNTTGAGNLKLLKNSTIWAWRIA